MQHEVTQRQQLLDRAGHILQEGWARHPIWEYDRRAIASGPLRIKEWDYYYIISHEHQVCLTVTVSDLGYLGLTAVCLVDLKAGTAVQQDAMRILPLGRTGLSKSSADGIVSFSHKGLEVHIQTQGNRRELSIRAERLSLPSGETGLEADVILTTGEQDESMNIATSWAENRKAFYLNEKSTCMQAEGTISYGTQQLLLGSPSDLAGLDWGRGRWTYRNRWYWGSTSALIDGVPFGFSIGYGFSDRTPASENVLFYDHTIHKLEEITFCMDTSDYMKPWQFTSSDGRFALQFTPIVDRSSVTDLLIITSRQHQVFGRFSGTVVLDDRRVLKSKTSSALQRMSTIAGSCLLRALLPLSPYRAAADG